MFDFLKAKGGMLTGAEIERQIKKGNIGIDPYDPSCINPNSYNLKLHPQLLVYKRDSLWMADEYKINRAVYFKDDITAIQKKCNVIRECGDNSAISNANVNTDNNTGSIIIDRIANPTTCCSITNISQKADEIDKITSALCRVTNTMRSNYNARINTLETMPNNRNYFLPPLDMKKDNETMQLMIPEEGIVLQPGVLYIGRTVERTWTDKYIPMINGRSSGGRLGISIHICAGFGDIGFDGTWTLEITCVEPVRIYPYSEIAQVCYFSPCGKVKNLYRGRYYKQEDATASRFYKPKEEV